MLKIKTWARVAVLCIGLACTSCLNIIEEYKINKDGSGTAKLWVDMSEVISMMGMFGDELDSLSEGGGSMSEIDEMFKSEDLVEPLREMPGISKVKSLNNKDKGIIGLEFDFATIEALNNAIAEGPADISGFTEFMGEGEGKLVGSQANVISMKGKKFERMLLLPKREGEKDEEKETMAMMEMMFKDAAYTVRYEFERQVKKVKGANAKSEGKTVTVEQNLFDLMKAGGDLSASVKLK